MPQGSLIVVEGIDGSGKSTLVNSLGLTYPTAITTREPYSRHARERIREWGNQPEMAAIAFGYDRACHLTDIVKPLLARGQSVICDRYHLSTLVYQGDLLGNLAFAQCLCVGPVADLTILLDIEPDLAATRLRQRAEDQDMDHFDKDVELQRRVRRSYIEQIALMRTHTLVVDASKSARDILSIVTGVMGDYVC